MFVYVASPSQACSTCPLEHISGSDDNGPMQRMKRLIPVNSYQSVSSFGATIPS